MKGPPPRRRAPIHWLRRALSLVLAVTACQPARPIAHPETLEGRGVLVSGRAFPRRYNARFDRAAGHHWVVWTEGRQAEKALIEADVPDLGVLDALVELGAVPGDNLTEDTWAERNDPRASEPDERVEGSRVHVFIRWNGETHPLHELLEETEPGDVDLRVGGHRALVPVWQSGCIACAFSCPGGRTSNAAYTIRDQALERRVFRAKTELWPPDETPVEVIFELVDDAGR